VRSGRRDAAGGDPTGRGARARAAAAAAAAAARSGDVSAATARIGPAARLAPRARACWKMKSLVAGSGDGATPGVAWSSAFEPIPAAAAVVEGKESVRRRPARLWGGAMRVQCGEEEAARGEAASGRRRRR